jgi:hypothetical protein
MVFAGFGAVCTPHPTQPAALYVGKLFGGGELVSVVHK